MNRQGVLMGLLALFLAGAAIIGGKGGNMAKAYMIDLQNGKPGFPALCAICGEQRSEKIGMLAIGNEASIIDFALSGFSLKPPQGPLLDVPVHESCAKRLRNRLLTQAAIFLAVAILLFGAGIKFNLGALISGLAVAVLMVPLLYLAVSKPPPVEFRHYRDGAYRLIVQNRNIAQAYAAHNGVVMHEGDYPDFEQPSRRPSR